LILYILFLLALLAAHSFVGDTVARIAGIAALCFWCAFRPSDDRRIKVFFYSVVMLVMSIAILFVLGLINQVSLLKYDLSLHAIDHTLGFCPAQLAVRVIQSQAVSRLMIGAYQMLPTMMVAGYGWALFSKSFSNHLLVSYFVTAICAALYLIVPASGPGFLLGGSLAAAHSSPAIGLIPLSYVANCIPSAHLSMAITIWFFNRSNVIARRVCLAFIFVTGFTTLALGEHYLIDLVLSFPFALFVVSSTTGRYRRAAAAMACVLLWLNAIRVAIDTLVNHPVWLWVAAAVTIAGSSVYLSMSSAEQVEHETSMKELVAA